MKDAARTSRNGAPLGPPPPTFRIAEVFASVQGESSLAGRPCTFVRTIGCGLRCRWCDTAYAFEGGATMATADILGRIEQAATGFVCLTGGEPLDQPGLAELAAELAARGNLVSIETGGFRDIAALPVAVRVVLDVKCPASAMADRNRWENLEWLRPGDEVKFVVADQNDYRYAADLIASHPRLARGDVEILLSPVHGELDPQRLVEWILRDRLRVRLNLQIHKWIWGAGARGV